LFFGGQLISFNRHLDAETPAQGWLVYQLTRGPKMLLGVVGGRRLHPDDALLDWGGSVADRHPKRTVVVL